MRSIELVFDDDTESAIRADWVRLAGAGLPSLASHTGASNRPHLTLAAGAELSVPPLHAFEGAFPLAAAFSGAQVFAAGRDKYVLARSVVLTIPLRKAHQRLHRGIGGAVPQTLPGAWTPHVTLARRLTGEQLGQAMDLLDLKLDGRMVGARLWDSSTKSVTGL
ncbi:2'-5' RNA ligase family protein [Pseudarthrobacter chlorophenolicus]|uniref:2'-5' RNA ligase family protein n=1 Tax=Pseudarthrobacter chlorophenolicus TaxID=85085 RepID=UPI0005F2F61D|nr:2'-5' RNA ligase family protein [Pseudarthrobacter chlorophenolicus]